MHKEAQLCLAIAAVRATLPIPKKGIKGKLDYETELLCASILLPAIGLLRMPLPGKAPEETVVRALEDAHALIEKIGPSYSGLRGVNTSIAITNIALLLLK